MPACREAHHSNPIRRDVEFFCPAAHQPDCPLRISQFDGVMIARSQAVLEDESGHAHGVKPVRHLPAFVVGGETSISAAWSNDDRRTREVRPPGAIQRESGRVVAALPQRSGSAVLPQQNRLRLSRGIVVRLAKRDGRRKQTENNNDDRVLVRVFISSSETRRLGPANVATTCCVTPTPHRNGRDHRKISASRCRWLRVRRTGWRVLQPPAREGLLRGIQRSCR